MRDAESSSLNVTLEQFMAARSCSNARHMARLAFAVAARARLSDEVLLRRVNQELDVWVYQRVAQLESERPPRPA